MTPFDLALALRGQNAESRANVFRALSPAQVVANDATLLAAALVESSGVVRGVLGELLDARPPEARRRRALPEGHIDLATQEALVDRWAATPGFAEGLLGYDRGRELLGRVSCDHHLLEDRLLQIARSAPPEHLAALLRLPLDLGGRLATLLEAAPHMSLASRRELAHALVDSSLAEGGVVSDLERERARASVGLWLEGLLQVRGDRDLEPPSFQAFVTAGASFGAGVVTETCEAPAARTLEALRPLTRSLLLTLGPMAQATLLDREALAADAAGASPNLRVVAWKLLLKNQLADAGEALDAALASDEPGVTVELLRVLPPGGLTRPRVQRLLQLLEHARLSVREATADVLARDPMAAAMAASSVDPRSPTAPLRVLVAQPPALASASVTAYLEVERAEPDAVLAFEHLRLPPPASWTHWARHLKGAPALRRAAREALLRLPPREAPELPALLQEVGDEGLVVACAWRFQLSGQHAAAEALLLREDVEDALAGHAIELLARYADLRAWVTLWRFVVGEARRRFGTRHARRRALEALRAIRAPRGDERLEGWPSWAGKVPARRLPEVALPLLLRDRDPDQARLALAWIDQHPVSTELSYQVEDLTWQVLGLVQRGPRARRWGLCWRRLFRRILPFLAPSRGRQRGEAGRARLLTALLATLLRRGSRALGPAVVEPLLDHPRPELARAATRLLVGLLHTPLEQLTERSRAEVVEEAIRVAHPAQVEGVIARRLAHALTDRELDPHGRLATALRWITLRPSPAHLPQLELLLARARGVGRQGLLSALGAIHGVPGGKAGVEAALRRELASASEARAEPRLRATLDALARFGVWSLVVRALPALAWAGETTRRRLRELVNEAAEHGHALPPSAIQPLLCHALADVRTLAIQLLRKSGSAGLWELVRPYGPSVRQRPTDFSKRFLGLCEDGFEASMVLTLEALLDHPNPEVARRALKLLNRQEQEISTTALLLRLEDPELRQPILTTFSTWSRRFLPAGLSAEQLEERRRQLRARISQLCAGPRGQALSLIADAHEASVPAERMAALLAIGRLLIEEERAWVATCLSDDDPAVQRAAAHACATLAPGEDLDVPLIALAQAREPEVRAAARAAIVARTPTDEVATVEGLLVDRAPEVTLATLAALRARPALLSEVELIPLLGDPDVRVRESVLRTLSEAPRPASVSALTGALTDPAPDVRLEALGVVGAWEATEEVASALGDLLADPSIHVSGAALELLGGHLGTDLGGGGALKGAPGDADVGDKSGVHALNDEDEEDDDDDDDEDDDEDDDRSGGDA